VQMDGLWGNRAGSGDRRGVYFRGGFYGLGKGFWGGGGGCETMPNPNT